jgi:hypothetical protein
MYVHQLVQTLCSWPCVIIKLGICGLPKLASMRGAFANFFTGPQLWLSV